MCTVVSGDRHLGQHESTNGRPKDRYVLVGSWSRSSRGRFEFFWGKGRLIASSKGLCSKGPGGGGKKNAYFVLVTNTTYYFFYILI